MAASPDWPDLPFVQAKAYGTGRDGRSIKYSVIHYTAGSERSTSAEDGAANDQRRTDGVSTHYFHDQNSTVQCVLLANRANAAFHRGNRLGIQHELCGTIQTREQWLDAASLATIDRAAFQVARDHRRFGIPIRRLTPAQVRACWYDGAPGGICGHVDVTNAYPEDGGTHTDPGTAFPWDVFMDRVQYYFEGADVALTDADVQKIWTWDLVNGPDVGQAYILVNQLVSGNAQILAAVQAIHPELSPADVAAIAQAVAPIVTTAVLDSLAPKIGEVVAKALVEVLPHVRLSIDPGDGTTPS